LRQMIFGGTTRYILGNAELPYPSDSGRLAD
jgi:hypothetical protein